MIGKTKLWLIIAAFFMLVGGIIFLGGMLMLKWDFTKLSTVKYETNTYEIVENYENITVVSGTAHIVLAPSSDGTCRVVCHEKKNVKHTVKVVDGVLSVQAVDTRKWYEHIGIDFGRPSITVYLPMAEYGALTVKTKTGDLEIPDTLTFGRVDASGSTGDVTCYASVRETVSIRVSTGDVWVEGGDMGSLAVTVSTGRVTVKDVTCRGDISIAVSTGKTALTDTVCQNVISDGDTGDIALCRVVAREMLSVKRSTGDVTFASSDGAKILVETDTGDVTGTLLSDKVYITKTSTGRIDVPQTVEGGRCEITTDTGNIKITVQKD